MKEKIIEKLRDIKEKGDARHFLAVQEICEMFREFCDSIPEWREIDPENLPNGEALCVDKHGGKVYGKLSYGTDLYGDEVLVCSDSAKYVIPTHYLHIKEKEANDE